MNDVQTLGTLAAHIPRLFDTLRDEGYLIGVDQYVAAQDLVDRLIKSGELRDTDHLHILLRSVVSASSDQQHAFGTYFAAWRDALIGEEPDEDTVEDKPRPSQEFADERRLSTIVLWGLAFLGVLFGLYQGYFTTGVEDLKAQIDLGTDAPLPTPVTAITTATQSQYWTVLIAVALFGGLFLLRSLFLRRQFVRRFGPQAASIYELAIKAPVDQLTERADLRLAAQRLNVHDYEPSDRLDAAATAELTACRGGVLSPVYGTRTVHADYVFLIDQRGEGDHLALMARIIGAALQAEGLHVHQYHYRSDPRHLYARTGDQRRIGLATLLDRHQGHRVAFFGSSDRLVSLLHDRTWAERLDAMSVVGVFEPETLAKPDSVQHLLRRSGVFLATPDLGGLRAFGNWIRSMAPQREPQPTIRAFGRYPEILRVRPSRWLDDTPPEPEEAETLIAQLRAYLGRAGYRWLAATAAFPRLALPITLHVAAPAAASTSHLAVLSSLPWFRAGRMPDWLRVRLLEDLPKDRETAVRDALKDMLVSAADARGDPQALLVVRNQGRGVTGLLSRLMRRQHPGSPLREYIFLEFMGLRRRANLGVAAPLRVARMLSQRRLQGRADHATVAAGTEQTEMPSETTHEFPTIETVTHDVRNPVFLGSVAITTAFVALSLTNQDVISEFFGWWRPQLTTAFDWLLVSSVNIVTVFCMALILLPVGRVRVGGKDARPDYSFASWFAMIFAAGAGLGIVFFCVLEPVYYNFSEGGNARPLNMDITEPGNEYIGIVGAVHHWGLEGWSVFSIFGLALAILTYNQGLPMTPRAVFFPLLRERVWGWQGHAIDILAVAVAFFALSTSLGLGAQQMSFGLSEIAGIEPSNIVSIILVVTLATVTLGSVLLGVDRGIRRLSNITMIVALTLLAFVFMTTGAVSNFIRYGNVLFDYVTLLPALSNPIGREDVSYFHGWTTFYWAWQFTWAPFVGMFMARISKGRTVREFVLASAVAPALFSAFWMSTFGGAAIDMLNNGGAESIRATVIDSYKPEGALFGFLRELPLYSIFAPVALLLVLLFLATSSDSGMLVVNAITAGGNLDGSNARRALWPVLLGVVAIILLLSNGLAAAQGAFMSFGVLFAVGALSVCLGLYRTLKHEIQR